MMYKIIAIVSGGKTGSTTLESGFSKYAVAHTPDTIIIRTHDESSIQELIMNASPSHKMLIINSFRDPVSRMISSMFQNLEHHIPDIYKTSDMIEQLWICKQTMDRSLSPDSPFYFEAYHPTDTPPEFVSDHLFISTDDVDKLWLRFDRIDEWESVIQTIFPGFVLVPDNVSSEKGYYDLYKAFRQMYKNPHIPLLIEHERYMWSHYYTEDEIMALSKKWMPIEANISPEPTPLDM